MLDSHTVNQIAAGEVVERPASVVKELVENSLDSGATWVEVTIEEAGRRLIEVCDDGCGMDECSLQLALQRHATSKISSVEDLNRVATMGFRGEALPSIGSVSKMTVSSGVTNGLRARIEVEGSQMRTLPAGPGAKGTTVRVEDLFFNTPARLKFLKSDATELSAIIDAVSRASLSRPDVKFVLRHGGTAVVQTGGDGSLANAVADVWGRESARALAPVDFYNGTARVRGFVSPPHFTKPTRSHQWMFVNGRPVRSRTLQSALDQALRSLTPDKRFPLAVLMLDVDPERVDVNVSPTKSEVRFHHEGAVFDAVKRGVSNALLETGMVPHAEGLAAANAALSSGQLGLEVSQPGGIFALAQWAQSPLQVEGAQSAELAATIGPASTSFLDGLRILAQVDNTFILAENDQGILVIDQHVAHERVCYEHLLATRGQGQIETQSLIQPETLHFDKRTIEVVAERFDELRAIGFEIERFGGDSVLVRSVPALWRGRQPLQVLRDVVNELADGLGQGCLNTLRDDVYIMCSCKMAIKAGDPLGQAEMEKLVFDLAQTENPFLCPHGRPITIVLPKSDLYRRFKRH